MSKITEMVDRIVADGKLTEEEHQQFQLAVKADGTIDKEEDEQVRRILTMIQDGELTITNGKW